MRFAFALIAALIMCAPVMSLEQTKDIDSLIEDMASENSNIRMQAAQALGESGDERALQPLIQALKDENPEVRIAAAAAFSSLGYNGIISKEAVDPLIQTLSDEDANVRIDAVNALGFMKDKRSVDPLIKALKDDEDWGVRAQAAVSLGAIGDTRAIEPLISALQDDSSIVRANTAACLGDFFKDSRAVEPLIQALQDKNASVRSNAAYALGGLGDKRARDPLAQALQDSDASVQEEASIALEKMAQGNESQSSGPAENDYALKIRGQVATGDFAWTADNFAGFYYDMEDGIGTERLTTTLSDGRLLDAGDVAYSTTASADDFAFEDWGSYKVIGFLGERCFAGYMDGSNSGKGYLFDKSTDKSALDNGQLLKVLIDDDGEKTVTSRAPLQLQEGYELALKSIDDSGNIVYLQLSRDGVVKDFAQINPSKDSATLADKTYCYRNPQVGNQKNLATIAIHFKNAFRGTEQNIATIDGVWQISGSPIFVAKGTAFDKMVISGIASDQIFMDNRRSPITLSRNADITLAGNLHFRAEDSDSLTYYIYKKEESGLANDKQTEGDFVGSSQMSGITEEPLHEDDEVDLLIKGLRDPDSDVRENASYSLGDLGDVRAVEPLISALKDEDSIVRMNAAQSLGLIGDSRAVEPLIQALNDEDSPAVRWNAARSLGWLEDIRAVEPLIQALDDDEIQVREFAITALGRLEDTRAVEPLITALNDEDSFIRSSAAESLGLIGDTRALEPLILALDENDSEEDKFVRKYAAKSLGQLGDSRAIDPLKGALANEDDEVVMWASYSLAKLGKTEYMDILRTYLNNEDYRIRWIAAIALGDLGDSTSVEPLIEALKAGGVYGWDIQAEAAEALGKIGDARAREPLSSALEDENNFVRDAAAVALEMLDLKEAKAESPIESSANAEEMGSTTPTQRLKKLKDMLDEGLITKEDYETKKVEILAEI